MRIYLDFDGTVVEHAFPKIGRAVPEAMRVIEALYKKGHEIILNTMRCEISNESLLKASGYIQYHPEYKVELAGSTQEKIYPIWEPDNKEQIFIDDSAYGTPLIPAVFDGNNMVDWVKVEEILKENSVL